jgi:hypothetical protein
MITRLVLVGMVAALGISVPTRPGVQGWVLAAHSWTAHQLADWDTGARRSTSGFTLPSVVTTVPAFEPIVVDERASGLADELNRFAERVDIDPRPAPSGRTPSAEGIARTTHMPLLSEFSAALGIGTPEMRGMAELMLAAEGSQGAVGPAEAVVTEHRAGARVSPADCIFTPSVAASSTAPPATELSCEPRSLPVADALQHEFIEPATDVQDDIASELNCLGEAFEIAAPAEMPPAAPKPPFDPIDPGTELDTGLAFELNRLSDGMAVAWSAADRTDNPQPESTLRLTRPESAITSTPVPAERPSSPGPSPDVAQAIRLTGEALHAWMSVMTGPAIVRITAR